MRGIAVLRVIFSSTIATSTALSSALFITLFAPSTGAVRFLLQSIGVIGADDRIDLLNDRRWAIVAVAVTSVWAGLGFGFILFSAALQSVPDELYESAALDGAGAWASFRNITLPLIRPVVAVAALVGTATSVLSFGQIDFLTHGGPDHTTNVLAYSLYHRAFRDSDISAAAVLAIALILVGLVLGIAQSRLLRNRFDDAIG
jgi:multiple sugar transport system permease protein/sn-glycerol 3-phosphate transport system permease protein